MNFFQTIKLSLKNIKNNKLRSILTMIGIVIGVSSVIVMVAIGNGASDQIMSQIQSLGTNLVSVNMVGQNKLSMNDIEDISKLKGIKNVAPTVTTNVTLNFDKTSDSYNITGTKGNFEQIRQLELTKGRFISDIDDENRNKVVVLGSNVASEMFGFLDPMNKYVKVNGESYKVVGVLKEQGSSMGGSIDDIVVAPLKTIMSLAKTSNIISFYVETENEDIVDSAVNNMKIYFQNKFDIDDDKKSYNIMSQKQLLDTMGSVTQTLSMLLAGISSISLIVGGIGVMNVMLVSVTERTKEIGIRKALGGQKKDIMFQFLIEALVLSSLGGLIGVTLGFGLGYALSTLGLKVVFSIGTTLMAFSVSMLVGIVFGIFPAYKAAKLKPIDALRYE